MYEKLIKWSEDNYSHLPWRINRSLYKTLVSEIMLQQTNVSTVINHFDRFIEKYPTIESLAKIDEEQILIDWKGLGYYRRAKNLLNAAKQISSEFKNEIPLDFHQLKQIKGIGDYTANAILSIGADKRAICVDANLERVLSRIYNISELKGPALQKEIYRAFSSKEICNEVTVLGARVYNEALMDLGRSICKARSVHCEICPLSNVCLGLKNENPLSLPKINKESEIKKKESFELRLLRVIVESGDSILVYKKNSNQWLSGQYEIPTFAIYSEEEDFSQYPNLNEEDWDLLSMYKTSITKYKISNFVLYASKKELANLSKENYEWKKVKGLNLSTGSMKALSH